MFGKNGGDQFRLDEFGTIIRNNEKEQFCPIKDNTACGAWCPRFHIRDNSDGCVAVLACCNPHVEIWITPRVSGGAVCRPLDPLVSRFFIILEEP